MWLYDIQMKNKLMKRCLTSLVISKMKIKTIMRYNYTHIGMAKKIKNSTKSWQGCLAMETFIHCLWEGTVVYLLRTEV